MVIGLCTTRILQGCSIRAIVSEVPLMYGIVAVRARLDTGLRVGISVTASVPSNKVRAVVVLTKHVVYVVSLVL